MASCSSDYDYQSIGKQCLEITKACVSIGQVVKMSLSIGSSFSYNFCSEQNGNPLPAVVKKKKKSPSTRGRDQKRRAAFLHKKAASSSLSNGDSMGRLWILHFRNPQRWIPVQPNQSCPLLHLNPDLWTRNPMILKTISAPSPLLMPTTSTPSASASQFPAYASPPNPFLLQEITQQ